MIHTIVQADCLDFLRAQPDGSLDLVFGSPPYEQARLYLEDGQDLGIARNTKEWVDWMVDVHEAAQMACIGLVAFVVAGQTRNYRWSASPALLMAELHRRGLNLRNPPIFSRVGIPGSGGPDWLRSDYEWIVCTTRFGKLPWSDTTALGHQPKWAPGGEMNHRLSDGARVNQCGRATSGHKDGDTQNSNAYDPPVLANPGNIIHCIVGGGVMASTGAASRLASLNEAPFPEKLAEFFILSFCPPSGRVCDPFSGSGTTAAMAKKHGRNFTGCDLRQSQVDLGLRRLAQEQALMFTKAP